MQGRHAMQGIPLRKDGRREMTKTTKLQADGPLQAKAIGAAAASMVSYAISRGVPIADILKELGIDPTQLLDPTARIKEDSFPKIMNMMAASLPGEAFPLDLAKVTPYSILGFVSSAVEFAPTVRDALELLIQYPSALGDSLHLNLEKTAIHTRFEINHPMDTLDSGATAEFALAMFYRMMGEWFDMADSVIEVEFAHKPKVPLELYEDFFGTKVSFEHAGNAFILAKEALEKPSRLPSKPLHEYARAHLERRRQESGQPDLGSSELRRVHDAICENASVGEYGASELAEKLNMSLRSLQRLVNQNGYELREMLEGVRSANARKLLSNRDLSIETVSHLLGYSDERAFRRSFKRWLGRTPSQFRKKLEAHSA